MKENILKDKTLLFAIRIVNLYKSLCSENKEYVLSKQVLRSGTSVGAMVREAEFGQSRLDFIHKLSIAQKEINETIYWLELLNKTNYLPNDSFESITIDAIEIIKLITSSLKTAKSKD
jgi:four helix bundle protein